MTAAAAAAGSSRAGTAAELAGAAASLRSSRPRPPARRRGRTAVDAGAGFVLGLLLWGWVVLPFVRGGPGEVRNVVRAKFINRGPDGEWLP